MCRKGFNTNKSMNIDLSKMVHNSAEHLVHWTNLEINAIFKGFEGSLSKNDSFSLHSKFIEKAVGTLVRAAKGAEIKGRTSKKTKKKLSRSYKRKTPKQRRRRKRNQSIKRRKEKGKTQRKQRREAIECLPSLPLTPQQQNISGIYGHTIRTIVPKVLKKNAINGTCFSNMTIDLGKLLMIALPKMSYWAKLKSKQSRPNGDYQL